MTSAHTLTNRSSLSTTATVLGIGVLAVSTSSILVRFAHAAGAGSLAIAALRLVIASLVLAPFALARCREEYRSLSGRDLLAAVLSGAFLGGHFATWILSLELTSVVSSVVLVSFGPLFVAVAAAIFLKERLTGSALMGMLLAIVGGIVIGLGDVGNAHAGSAPLVGNALALAGAVCLAPYLIIGRALRAKLSLLAYVALVYGAAAVVLLVVAVVTRTPLTFANPQAWLWITLLALVPQLIGHTAFNFAVRRMPASFATIPVLGEPIGSSILAIVLLHETVTSLTLAGAALALAGIAVMSTKRGGDDGGR